MVQDFSSLFVGAHNPNSFEKSLRQSYESLSSKLEKSLDEYRKFVGTIIEVILKSQEIVLSNTQVVKSLRTSNKDDKVIFTAFKLFSKTQGILKLLELCNSQIIKVYFSLKLSTLIYSEYKHGDSKCFRY